jgi:hypothetical protein
MTLSGRLFQEGVFAQGIAFPTVAGIRPGSDDRHRDPHPRGPSVRAGRIWESREGAGLV